MVPIVMSLKFEDLFPRSLVDVTLCFSPPRSHLTFPRTRLVFLIGGSHSLKMMTPMRYVVLVLGVVVGIASSSTKFTDRRMYL